MNLITNKKDKMKGSKKTNLLIKIDSILYLDFQRVMIEQNIKKDAALEKAMRLLIEDNERSKNGK